MVSRFRLAVAVAALGMLALIAVVPAGAPGLLAAYVGLMWLPGAAMYFLVERRTSVVEAITSGLLLSPVITACLAVLLVWSGRSPETAARGIVVMGAAAAAGALLAARRWGHRREALTGRQWAVLAACILGTLALAGVLPLTNEWWRFRSDAWFHHAVIDQIDHTGLPPQDPYFAGFTLQYMWFYHVLVLLLSRSTSLDSFWVMPLVNLQSLAGVTLATFLFAGVFTRRFGHRVASSLTVVYGLNGLFWLLLPFKTVRAFIGEVRGLEELSRTYSLTPFDMYQVKKFVTIYFSQDFLLDKFLVATAFGLAFGLMALFWWATTEYLRARRPFPLAAAGLSLVGMLGFHALFGVVMLATAGGGMLLSLACRRLVDEHRMRPSIELGAVVLAALAVMSPYLYAITHLKQTEHAFPFDLSLQNTAGIVISSAGVIVLAAFQRSFFRGRDAARRYVQLSLLTVAVFSAVMTLPDANTYDKLPIFTFYPLAVIGGWTLADQVARRQSAVRRLAAAFTLALLFLVPVNAISLAGCYNTPGEEMYSADEGELAAWVRGNTSRDAVFIDVDDEVFLLVAGPRRYFCGRVAYARQWQYDKLRVARRLHARDALLGGEDLDLTALRELSKAPWELYVIDRGDPSATSAVSQHPELFRRVHAAGDIVLYRVNRGACDRAARRLEAQGRQAVPGAELIRESEL